ncbi:MAG: hypothetical protein ACYSX0_07960 [Planctomycetota bacterium]
MTFGESLDKTYQGMRRATPVLIPGFASLWAMHASGSFKGITGLIFAPAMAEEVEFGGFLALVLMISLGSAVVGLLLQGIRVGVYDLIREQFYPGEIDPDSRHAMHYALYANLAVAWLLILFVRQLAAEKLVEVEETGELVTVNGVWPWEGWGHAAFFLLFLWGMYGLWEASVCCFGRATKPAPKKKATAKKKPAR